MTEKEFKSIEQQMLLKAETILKNTIADKIKLSYYSDDITFSAFTNENEIMSANEHHILMKRIANRLFQQGYIVEGGACNMMFHFV